MKRTLWGPAIISITAFIVGCGGGGESSSDSARRSTTASSGEPTTTRVTRLEEAFGGPTITPAPSPTTTGSSAGGPGTTVSSGATPSPTTVPTTVPATVGQVRTLSFGELLANRAALVGEGVRVEGRVVYTMSCPPTDTSACAATGYLTDKATLDLPSNVAAAQAQAILLYEGGRTVGCSNISTLAGLECRGFKHQGQYSITGVVSRLVVGGSPTNTVIMEVTGKQLL